MRTFRMPNLTYAPLTPNPTDEKTDDDMKSTESCPHRLPPSTPSIPSRFHFNFGRKSRLYLRLLIFCIIEASYIILAAICLARPIPLHIPLNLADSGVKGGFTVIFVVWQILAIFIVSELVTDAFGREWSTQLKHSNAGPSGEPRAVVPVRIDRVSIITSGFLDRIRHLLVGKSSGTFKLAFVASLLFLVLRSFGPGAINVGVTLIDQSTTVQIGRIFSNINEDEVLVVMSTILRAKLVVQLEQGEGSLFGFKLPPNILAPVPKVDLASFNGTIEYDSDVIEFHYDCHWEAPQFHNTSGSPVIVAAGQQWYLPDYGLDDVRVGSSISPLYLKNLLMIGEVNTTAIIFAGGNSSYLDQQSDTPVPFGIDLGSLPTTFNAPGPRLASKAYYAPLSSVLACNPHTQITGGRISVTNDGNLTIIASGKTPIGNIPSSAANFIFASALMGALNPDDTGNTNGVNAIASTMFMSNSSTINWTDAHGNRPLNLSLINDHMDSSMLSGAKAYLDGFRRNGSSLVIDYELDSVSAVERSQALTLVTSDRFFCLTVVIVAISIIVLLVLCRVGLAQKGYPFNLNHVVAVLRGLRDPREYY